MKTWFQNRRMKHKKVSKKSINSSSSSSSNGKLTHYDQTNVNNLNKFENETTKKSINKSKYNEDNSMNSISDEEESRTTSRSNSIENNRSKCGDNNSLDDSLNELSQTSQKDEKLNDNEKEENDSSEKHETSCFERAMMFTNKSNEIKINLAESYNLFNFPNLSDQHFKLLNQFYTDLRCANSTNTAINSLDSNGLIFNDECIQHTASTSTFQIFKHNST